ncbi:MAG TPA: hypothetical protein VK919_14980 [Solirubrobacterales bacterium]|nr:hypothetical protein [Solirubrobacterales bacterium]
MKIFAGKRPSPGTLIAVAALALVVGGSAVAAGPFGAAEVRQVKQIAKKQAKKQVRRGLRPARVRRLALNPGWERVAAGAGPGPPRAFRDRLGVVHLAGVVFRASGTENVALRLPRRLRPGFELELPAICDEPGIFFDPRPGVVFIDVNGDVEPIDTPDFNCFDRLSLDGISFRAGG